MKSLHNRNSTLWLYSPFFHKRDEGRRYFKTVLSAYINYGAEVIFPIHEQKNLPLFLRETSRDLCLFYKYCIECEFAFKERPFIEYSQSLHKKMLCVKNYWNLLITNSIKGYCLWSEFISTSLPAKYLNNCLSNLSSQHILYMFFIYKSFFQENTSKFLTRFGLFFKGFSQISFLYKASF